jgi:hypothetical protein
LRRQFLNLAINTITISIVQIELDSAGVLQMQEKVSTVFSGHLGDLWVVLTNHAMASNEITPEYLPGRLFGRHSIFPRRHLSPLLSVSSIRCGTMPARRHCRGVNSPAGLLTLGVAERHMQDEPALRFEKLMSKEQEWKPNP